MCLPAPPPRRPSVNDCGHFRPRSPSSFNLDFFYFQRVVPKQDFLLFFLRILLFLAEVNGPLPPEPPSTRRTIRIPSPESSFLHTSLEKNLHFSHFFLPTTLKDGGCPPSSGTHTHTLPPGLPTQKWPPPNGKEKIDFPLPTFSRSKIPQTFS